MEIKYFPKYIILRAIYIRFLYFLSIYGMIPGRKTKIFNTIESRLQ